MLYSKCGFVSQRNEEFLLCTYMNALKDTLKVLLTAYVTYTEKLDWLCEMFLCEHAKVLAAYEHFGGLFNAAGEWTEQRRQLWTSAANWLLQLEEVPDEQVERYCELGEFLCAAVEDSCAWMSFKKLKAQFLLDQGRTEEAKSLLNEMAELLPNDNEIMEMHSTI
jgi:tetratricopeptide (TPR) repeat protein